MILTVRRRTGTLFFTGIYFLNQVNKNAVEFETRYLIKPTEIFSISIIETPEQCVSIFLASRPEFPSKKFTATHIVLQDEKTVVIRLKSTKNVLPVYKIDKIDNLKMSRPTVSRFRTHGW